MNESHLKVAAEQLKFLRGGTPYYEESLKIFREEVQAGNLSLADDLKTSEEELKRLRLLGCKVTALGWLRYLREGTEQHEAFLKYFRQEVQKGSLSLADDLKTSEEELEKLRVLGCKIAGDEWRRRLQESYPGQYDGLPGHSQGVVECVGAAPSSFLARVRRGFYKPFRKNT